MNILIIGGNGGIGHALLTTYLERHPKANIFATYRRQPAVIDHDRGNLVRWFRLDLTDEQQVMQLATHFEHLDILINATGLLYTATHRPEKALKQFDLDFFYQNLQTNTAGSILLAKHFEKALKASSQSYFVVFSARIGSIQDNGKGGWLSYRVSKAALNMAIKTISIEWQLKLPRCKIVLFHPGTTDTALSEPFHRGLSQGQLHSATYAAEQCVHWIESEQIPSGSFIDFRGQIISW